GPSTGSIVKSVILSFRRRKENTQMRRLMNNRTRHFGTSVGLSAAALFLAAGAAFGADVPLATLNGGPSSANVPTAAGTEAAITVRFPREIVDPNVAYGLDANADENTDIIQVDGDETVG